MPPASLPAIPAMSPGPITARNASDAASAAEPAAQAQELALFDAVTEACEERDAAAKRAPGDAARLRRVGRQPAGGPAVVLAAARRRGTRCRQPRGSTTSIASSTVTMPTRRPSSSTHRHGQQVVARDDLRDLVLGGEHAHGDRFGEHDRLDRRRRARDDEVAQREHADQAPLVVGDVDVVDGLGVGLELAQPVDRLRGREVWRAPRRTRWS